MTKREIIIFFIFMLLTILFLSIIVYFFAKRYAENYWWFSIALVLKLLAGIGIGILYFYYYKDGDTIKYAKDLNFLNTLSWKEWWYYLTQNQFIPKSLIFRQNQPRAMFFVKSLTLIHRITQGNYWTLSLWLSTINFLACWWCYIVIVRVFSHLQKVLFFCLFISPSFVFWTSGVLKESLLVGCVFICQAIFLGIVYKKLSQPIWFYILLLIPILLFVWKVKYYFAAALIGFMIPYVFVKTFWKKDKYELLIYLGIVALCLFSASFLHPNLRLENILEAIVLNHDKTIKSSSVGGYIVYFYLEPNISSFLKNILKAWLSGLFSPLSIQWNIRLFESLINWSVLLTIGLSTKKYFRYKWTIEVWICIMLISFLAIFLAFASPNYGSLVRYKTIFLPWLWLLVFYPYHHLFPIYKENIRHEPRIDKPTDSEE